MAWLHNFWYLFIKLNVDEEYVYDSYEDDVDECKGGSSAIKELDNDTMSIHDKFKEMDEISKNDHWKHGKLCCSDHSYVFQDLCEVHLMRLTERLMQTLHIFYKMISVDYHWSWPLFWIEIDAYSE